MSAFGQDFHYLDTPNSKFLDAYNFAFDNIFKFFYFLFRFAAYLPTPYVRKMTESLSTLDTLIYEIIQKAKERPVDSPQKTLLDMMIDGTRNDTGSAMTNEELRNNVL